MFTGLIEAAGTIVELVPSGPGGSGRRIVVSAPGIAPRLHTGDSVAVSGVCLTALNITATTFAADLAQETMQRTTLTRLAPGMTVNLELPTPAGAPMGGHVVQGHVDGVGSVLAVEPVDPKRIETTDWRLSFRVSEELSRYIAAQGSITVDGISLTVANVQGEVVSVAIIPHTYGVTTIHTLRPGTPINVEVDVMAKYAERQSQSHAAQRPGAGEQWSVTDAYLLRNGY